MIKQPFLKLNRIFIVLLFSIFLSCNIYGNKSASDVNELYNLNETISEALILGTFSPPAASRAYAYCNIAAYEALILNHDSMLSLSGQISYTYVLPKIDVEKYIPSIAMIFAFSSIAKDIVWHDYLFEDLEKETVNKYKKIVGKKQLEYSKEIGNQLANNIKKELFQDGYKQTRDASYYKFIDESWAWETTAPKFAEAIEPWWHTITPLILDSASLFRPQKYPDFDTVVGSKFYNEAIEVVEFSNKLMGENTEIADFWDCNPYLTKNKGHVTYTIRQMSPPAHWIGISIIASKKKSLNIIQSSEILTTVSIGLSDAFISCWEAKYYYNLIRPVTYINRYIDNDWKPLLETPLFPEYTSGHSVISRTAAVILEDYFGKNFFFIDSSEVPFGKKPREFYSFIQASNEAAISRLYGGIHFKSGIEKGIEQGDSVGKYILKNIVLKKK
jgi:hypothetical protein